MHLIELITNVRKTTIVFVVLTIGIFVFLYRLNYKPVNENLITFKDDFIKRHGFFLIAHRGGVVNDTLSENSIAALEEAIKRGYTHVEVDVRLTKDRRVVCFHDDNLWRSWKIYKNISDLTLSELNSLAAHKHKNTIIRFEEFCAACQGRIHLMVDIKGCSASSIQSYVQTIDSILTTYNLIEETLIIGNRQISTPYFSGKAKIAMSLQNMKLELAKNSNPNVSKQYFVFGHAKDFNQATVDYLHENGIVIIVSINRFHYWKRAFLLTPGFNDIRTMIKLGVDGLQIDACYDTLFFTNYDK